MGPNKFTYRFLGPTWVGKTETVKALIPSLFNNKKAGEGDSVYVDYNNGKVSVTKK